MILAQTPIENSVLEVVALRISNFHSCSISLFEIQPAKIGDNIGTKTNQFHTVIKNVWCQMSLQKLIQILG